MTTFLNDDLAPADGEEQAEAMAYDALVYELSVVLMRLDGNDGDPHHLIWCGGPTPEPWGDAWQKYEEQAEDVINAIGEGSAQAMVTALGARAALASQVVQEPVAWIEHHKGGDNLNWEPVDHPYAKATPLYAVPIAAGEPDSVHLTERSGEAATGREDVGGVQPSAHTCRFLPVPEGCGGHYLRCQCGIVKSPDEPTAGVSASDGETDAPVVQVQPTYRELLDKYTPTLGRARAIGRADLEFQQQSAPVVKVVERE